MFCFGENTFGMLGNGSSSSSSTPSLVRGDLTGKIVIKISCGACFSACVLDNGTVCFPIYLKRFNYVRVIWLLITYVVSQVYAWGANGHGQLGLSPQSHPSVNSPTRVPDISNVRKIVCGYCHVLAINLVYDLFSWGFNKFGALGLGDTVSRHKPTRIETIGK